MNFQNGRIYGISLGPGDPGLITMKGLKALKAADKIFFPGSVLNGKERSSYSAEILKHYELGEEKLECFYLNMNGNPEEADEVYEDVFRKALKLYNEGLTIAFVSEGDISFYSTFIYLLYKFQKEEIPVNIIPGVSSIMSAGAEGRFPLAIQDEKVAILPRMKDTAQLCNLLETFDTIILIKIRSVSASLFSAIKDAKLSCLYCERLGTDKQYISRNIEELNSREIPYFSLLIIRKK